MGLIGEAFGWSTAAIVPTIFEKPSMSSKFNHNAQLKFPDRRLTGIKNDSLADPERSDQMLFSRSNSP